MENRMTSEERVEFIKRQLLAEWDYSKIGKPLSITKQRVEQIIAKHHLKEEIMKEYYPGWLNSKETAIKLGINQSTLDDLIAAGKIAFKRLGRRLQIDPEVHLSCLACGQPREKQKSYCPSCCKEASHLAHNRAMFRSFYRQQGKPLTPRMMPTYKKDYKKVKSLPEKA